MGTSRLFVVSVSNSTPLR